jgi:hypothetical protein
MVDNKYSFDRALSLVSYMGSATSFERFVINSHVNREKLSSEIRSCGLEEYKIRFNVWRMLMGVYSINNNLQQKVEELTRKRK